MHNLNWMRGLQVLAGSTLLMFATLSHAQFVWVDAKGVKQYSDRPPPPSVPTKNILKSRGMALPADADSAPVAAATAAPAKTTPASLAEREADYRKRQVDKAEADKKAGAEADQAKAKLAACNTARQIKTQLDTGAPLRDTDAERSWLDDKKRAEQKASANKTIAEHCA